MSWKEIQCQEILVIYQIMKNNIYLFWIMHPTRYLGALFKRDAYVPTRFFLDNVPNHLTGCVIQKEIAPLWYHLGLSTMGIPRNYYSDNMCFERRSCDSLYLIYNIKFMLTRCILFRNNEVYARWNDPEKRFKKLPYIWNTYENPSVF